MTETYHPRGMRVHGYRVREHPFYTIWADMKTRCRNEADETFLNYGARGINYCSRWKHFKNFAEDMWPRTADHLTLERRDNDRGYSPDNCYWADRSTQCINRRTFKNNTTGARGVVKVGSRFYARFDYKGERYNLGRFDTLTEAVDAREQFIERFMKGDASSLEMTDRRVRVDSSVGIRGVSRHADGRGFIVRVTVKGNRKYLGYFQDLPTAASALEAARHDG